MTNQEAIDWLRAKTTDGDVTYINVAEELTFQLGKMTTTYTACIEVGGLKGPMYNAIDCETLQEAVEEVYEQYYEKKVKR